MKNIKASLLASCLVASVGVAAFAQTESTTATSSSEKSTTTKTKKHGLRKHRIKNIFKKSSKTESTTTK